MRTIAFDDEDERLFERAEQATGISDEASLVREALRSLLAREASRQLAGMGGSAPGLVAPPRRRFG